MTHRTRIKICGITRPQDALQAQALGADAIGLVFVPESPRQVNLESAQSIASVLSPFVTAVGLFVNQTREEIRAYLDQLPLQLLQFHGDESNEFCASFQKPWIKAIRVSGTTDIKAEIGKYPNASGILLDAFSHSARGGTGEIFDWNLVPELDQSMILAGGLKASNVEDGISALRPYAVDVSSGVELSPGLKDVDKMRDFISAVQRADLARSE